MSEPTDDIDKITAPPAPIQRIWPSRSNLTKCVFLVLAGLGVGVASALVADWVPAGIALVLFAYGVCSIGWVEIEGDRITQRRLIRGGSTRLIEIREIGLHAQRVKATKWWYPVINTHSGDSIDLGSLKSVSQKRAEARVQQIHALLGSASAAHSDDPANANISSEQEDEAETAESEVDPMNDFDLTPGYTAYLREKALEETTSASAEPPIPNTPVAPIADLAPVAAVAVAESALTPPPLASEPAPEVFEPQPAPQVLEPQPAPQVLEPQPAPALAVFAPQATATPTPELQQQAEQQAYAQQQAQLAQQQAQHQAYERQQAQLAQQQAQHQAYERQQAQLAQQQAEQQAYAQQQARLAQQQAQQQAYERQQAQLAQQQAQQQAYAQQQAQEQAELAQQQAYAHQQAA